MTGRSLVWNLSFQAVMLIQIENVFTLYQEVYVFMNQREVKKEWLPLIKV